MVNKYVRIYSSPQKEADIIGFSESIVDTTEHQDFRRFLMTNSEEWRVIYGKWQKNEDGSVAYVWDDQEAVPEGAVSWRYVEVVPKLSEENLQKLGALCTGGIVDGRRIPGIVDGGNDGVLVIDNRDILPGKPYGRGRIIDEG